MKNLVIFHMESLSSAIFKLNCEYFPNIYKWERNFEYYVNYYSTATSTLMVMADLFFGDMSVFEESDYLENIFTIQPEQKTIFEYLHEFGYISCAFYYGYADHRRNERLNRVINKNGEMWQGDDAEAFRREFEKYVNTVKPFAVFIEENVSHVEYHGTRVEKNKNPEYIHQGKRYQTMDATVGEVMEILQNSSLLDNTVVILYGDHGDGYWFHGFHEGYTHAIEPYINLIHCPLFVYNGSKKFNINNQLVSTTDVYSIILNELNIEKKTIGSDFVISRNLFAKQTRRARIFNKSYCVTDGEYTLLLTRQGMAMYENRIDEYCQNNVLDFFQLKGGKLKYLEKYDRMISSHYKGIMTWAEKAEIERRFERLEDKMYEYISENKYLKRKYNLRKIYRSNRFREFDKKRIIDALPNKIESEVYTIKRIIEKRKRGGMH